MPTKFPTENYVRYYVLSFLPRNVSATVTNFLTLCLLIVCGCANEPPIASGSREIAPVESIRPGDLIDVREIRNSERGPGMASIFADASTAQGAVPKIVIQPPDLKELERHAGAISSSY